MGIPYDYQTDWTRIARLIVHDALRTAPGERVLIHADPTYFPALTEAVRIEINRAGAVELAAHMLHPPGLERARRELRRREDPGLRAIEDRTVAAQEGTEGGKLALSADDPRGRRSPAGRAQRRSTTAAIAWPWPMHIDATP